MVSAAKYCSVNACCRTLLDLSALYDATLPEPISGKLCGGGNRPANLDNETPFTEQ